MTLHSEPLGTGSTRIVHREANAELLEIPPEDIKSLFQSAGVLLFRGFDVDPMTMLSFAAHYSSRFNRDRLRPPVAGSDGYVQMVTEGMGYVEPHSEQANSPFRPDAIWFCCEVPAESEGETLVWDGVRLWDALPRSLQDLFGARKLRFFQRYAEDRWQRFLGDGSTLADARRALDGVPGLSYHVADDHSIYMEYVCPAVVKTRFGQRDAFANSLLSERHNTLGALMSFEDGSLIPDDVVATIEDTMSPLTEKICWQAGDLAVVDNSRFLHGRNAYRDPRRKIFSTLSFLNF
jgi:alpha-ketoglutarate-dependent taurine dioxygenase